MKEKEIIRKNGKDVEVEYAPVLLEVFIGDLSLAGELNTSIFKHKDIPEDMYLLMEWQFRVRIPIEEGYMYLWRNSVKDIVRCQRNWILWAEHFQIHM